MELRQRKKMRLQGYDYGRAGYYFITICVAERAELLGRVVEECRGAHCAPAYVTLSDVGRTVEHVILQIPEYHKGVCVDKYVIMPNHIHMILTLAEDGGRTLCAPTHRPAIPQTVHGMKEAITKTIGFSIWQKSYHDHIIRNDADYRRIWEYIDNNPAKWREDCYYKDGAI